MAEKLSLTKIAEDGYSLILNESIEEEPDISKKIPTWINEYFAKLYGEKRASILNGMLQKEPLKISPMISKAREMHTGKLVEEVSKNPDYVIKELGEKYIYPLASIFFKKSEYGKLEKALSGDGDVRSVFSEMFGGGELWRYAVSITGEETLKETAKNYIQMEIQQQAIENLTSGDGKIDRKKAISYIAGNTSKQGKDDRMKTYTEIGKAYARTTLDKKQSQNK